MVTLLILSTAGVVFAAAFPMAFSCSRQAQERKIATAIAQRKLEQIRASNYESLTPVLLRDAGTIDSSATSSPYSFTSVDGVADQLTAGTGELTLEDIADSLRRVRVTVAWQGQPGKPDRTIQLTCLVADKRTRRVN